MIETLKWMAGLALAAAVGGAIGTRIAIYMIERRASKTADKFIKAAKENPELKEYADQLKEILEFVHAFVKKAKEKQNKKV